MEPVPLRGGCVRERDSNRSDGRKRSSVRSTVLIMGWPSSGLTSSDTLGTVSFGGLSLVMILEADPIGPGRLVADGAQSTDQGSAVADDGLVGEVFSPERH